MLKQKHLPIILAGFFLFSICLALIIDRSAPLPLPEPADFAHVVVDRNGIPLRAFADTNGVWRYPVSLEQVSDDYIQALIGYEDRWFYYHPGVNPFSVVRAAWQNLSNQTVVSGGSTLTMQVARLIDPVPHTFLGKIQQSLRALQLEWHLNKKQILELYLNLAPFGGTLEGVEAASYSYFGKKSNQLLPSEAALLAVLPQSPSRLRPDRYPLRAQAARDKLIKRLAQYKVWPQQKADEARQDIVAVLNIKQPMLAPHLSRRLKNLYPKQPLIRSTIDIELQRELEALLKDHIAQLPLGTSAAALVIDNQTSQALAYIGSADFLSPQLQGHVDITRAIRSPGSLLKPFLYGKALDQGLIHSQSLMVDAPRISSYRPENFNQGFSGPVSASAALRQSLNIPAVNLLEVIGPADFSATLSNAGINLHLPKNNLGVQARPNLSLILGGVGATMEQLTSGYVGLVNGGQVRDIQYVLNELPSPQANNLSVDKALSDSRYLMSSGASWIIYDILRQASATDRLDSSLVVQDFKNIAWKTGTSYGYRDAWAMGATPSTTVAIWVGRPDGSAMPGYYGRLTAAPIMFASFRSLQAIYQTENNTTYLARPESVSQQKICWPLGTLLQYQSAESCQQQHQAWLLDQTAPVTLALQQQALPNPLSFWINPENGKRIDAYCGAAQRIQAKAQSVTLWPLAVEPWIASDKKRQRRIPLADPSCKKMPLPHFSDVKITQPTNNARILVQRRHNKQIQALKLTARGGQLPLLWYANGKLIGNSRSSHQLQWWPNQAGQYQILMIDANGTIDQTNILLSDLANKY